MQVGDVIGAGQFTPQYQRCGTRCSGWTCYWGACEFGELLKIQYLSLRQPISHNWLGPFDDDCVNGHFENRHMPQIILASYVAEEAIGKFPNIRAKIWEPRLKPQTNQNSKNKEIG